MLTAENPPMTAEDVQVMRYQLQNWPRDNWDSAELLRLMESHERLRAGLLHIFEMAHDPAVEDAISALLATGQKEG